MKNRKKADTYRFNGHPSFHAGSIHSVQMAELEARINQFEAKLSNPDDPDDKKWTARWLERFRKELDKKRVRRSLKQREQQDHRRTTEFSEGGERVDYWDEDLRKAVRAMIPKVEGGACVNVGGHDGGVYVCRGISGLGTDEDCFNGQCDWVDPPEARPDELTDGMAIDCASVRLGPGWWQDMYFGWYFVYDPALVARSLAGDHSWVQSFLASAGQGQG